ncbi:MAG: thioredoxin domain-containing protein [Rhodospirillales bacterium]|nr:thioredoxin domain-containing protein [Rhodospirillales bacterium]MBO6787633.1 thioredoxin domain-containing protein [Rhodospirillales bacterium]
MSQNRLGQETSPYLLQHKDNPVHWYPWGEDALAAARSENKPILLSVGYAACHWCHVMAHESFEDPAIADEMNARFINVKVDREERPDIDNIYQTALQLLGEHGGWPLTMFLTPDGDPFWGGTYFPPTPRYGRPGFDQVLKSIAHTYANAPDQVQGNVGAIRDAMTNALAPRGGGGMSLETLDQIAAAAVRMVDPYTGGTQGAPKFPQPMFFRFLWMAHLRSTSAIFADAVTLSLDNMCQGGIYDHLGGGFARYSTDDRWLAPHFEKMLYDNALLLELMSDVWLKTKSPLYAKRASETVDWLLREMKNGKDDADGFAFAGALDADSEGEEGKFYVWSADEVTDVLSDDADAFAAVYDVTPGGNWEGKTILNRLRAMAWDDDQEAAMAPLRAKLMARRDGRIRPGRDDKILADWNGLAVAGLVRAGVVFNKPAWIEIARGVFDWVRTHMTGEDGRLRHSFCAGQLQHPAVIDDYANMARAALFLAEATGDSGYIAAAEDWAAIADTHYYDPDGGGYFMAAGDTPGLVARPKPIFDNAQPAGNGTMAEVLVRLALMTGKPEYRERAEHLIGTFMTEEAAHNLHHPTLLIAWEMLLHGTQIVIAGDPEDAATKALARVALTSPNRLSVVTSVAPDQVLPADHAAAGKGMVDGKPAAYVCVGPTCSLPVTDPAALADALGNEQ